LVVLLSISGVSGLAGLLLGRSNGFQAILLASLVSLIFIVVGFLDYTGRIRD
jgi:hypothetical protein